MATLDIYSKGQVDNLLAAKADTTSLATVATTGDYDDLLNKPTIPAAQIQSDWTQADNTKVDFIKNKPTLAAVATSGSYSDLTNKPTIPTITDNTTYYTITYRGEIMATVEFYSKAQVDAKIPSAAQLVPTTSGATSGDVLTFDGSSVGWAAGGGGGKTITSIADGTAFMNWLSTCQVGDIVLFSNLQDGSSGSYNRVTDGGMIVRQIANGQIQLVNIGGDVQRAGSTSLHNPVSGQSFMTPSGSDGTVQPGDKLHIYYQTAINSVTGLNLNLSSTLVISGCVLIRRWIG